MKSLWRSVISSGVMWFTYVLFGYFVLIRGVFLTGQLDYLIFGNDGKNLLISIGYCAGFIVFTANAYKKALLPLYEMYISKEKIEKTTRIEWMQSESSGAFLPWTEITHLRISNEKGIFSFPDRLSCDMKNQKVRILFLRRSKLVLRVIEME